MTRTAITSGHKLRPQGLRTLAVLAVAGMMAGSFAATAQAGGFFDSLFGGFGGAQRRAAPTYAYSDPAADLTNKPDTNVRSETPSSASVGKAFCVRLCDGRYYPITSGSSNSTPVQMCSAMCPAAKTKIFHGGEIDSATDATGIRYTKLDQAFAYRKNVVPGCTCNGKDAFGLVPAEVMADPTLRAGDVVATQDGLKTFQGGKNEAHKAADFAPTGNATKVSGTLRDRLSSLR